MATPVPYTWTGFYVGGQIGGGWARTSSSFSGFDVGDTPPAVSPNGGGLIVGGQLGYNRQFGFWLAGVETDIAGAFIKGNASSVSPNTFFTVPTEQDINWFGALRGRLGILPMDRLLLFATGGLAYGGVAVSSISLAIGGNCITSSCGSGSASATRTGSAVGGGVLVELRHDQGGVSVRRPWQHVGDLSHHLGHQQSHDDVHVCREHRPRWTKY